MQPWGSQERAGGPGALGCRSGQGVVRLTCGPVASKLGSMTWLARTVGQVVPLWARIGGTGTFWVLPGLSRRSPLRVSGARAASQLHTVGTWAAPSLKGHELETRSFQSGVRERNLRAGSWRGRCNAGNLNSMPVCAIVVVRQRESGRCFVEEYLRCSSHGSFTHAMLATLNGLTYAGPQLLQLASAWGRGDRGVGRSRFQPARSGCALAEPPGLSATGAGHVAQPNAQGLRSAAPQSPSVSSRERPGKQNYGVCKLWGRVDGRLHRCRSRWAGVRMMH